MDDNDAVREAFRNQKDVLPFFTRENVNNKIGGLPPLIWAALYKHTIQTFQGLLDLGANVNLMADGSTSTALTVIAECGNIPVLNLLAPHATQENKERAFVRTAQLNLLNVIRLLHEHYGVSLDVRVDGKTALMNAALKNRVEIVRYLCEHGANVHLCDDKGENALRHAMWGHNVGICEYLCARGVLVYRLPRFDVFQFPCIQRQYMRTQIFALVSRAHIGAQIGRIPNEIFRRILDILAGKKE